MFVYLGVDNTPPPSQPVAPEIFFGRDDIVCDIVNLFAPEKQVRVAILGAAGIGKTSTAKHVLHCLKQFEYQQYFVGCDAVTSADTLAALILQVLRVPPVQGEHMLTVLHQALLVAPPTLLLLDNFESVWQLDPSRDGVRDLLSKIGSAKKVSLIVTMRGSAPPSNIKWTHCQILPPLSSSAAKKLFLEINPLTLEGDHTFQSNIPN